MKKAKQKVRPITDKERIAALQQVYRVVMTAVARSEKEQKKEGQ